MASVRICEAAHHPVFALSTMPLSVSALDSSGPSVTGEPTHGAAGDMAGGVAGRAARDSTWLLVGSGAFVLLYRLGVMAAERVVPTAEPVAILVQQLAHVQPVTSVLI